MATDVLNTSKHEMKKRLPFFSIISSNSRKNKIEIQNLISESNDFLHPFIYLILPLLCFLWSTRYFCCDYLNLKHLYVLT